MEEAPQSGELGTFDIGGPERDVLFGLLSHPYRRFVLHYLDHSDGARSIGEVATELGAWQTALPLADRSATGIDAIESTLHHHHFPKLAAADVIEYDSTRETVTLGACASEAIPYLREI